MKKRMITLALLTAVLLTGCNSESASTNNAETETQTQETETQETEIMAVGETETQETETVAVGETETQETEIVAVGETETETESTSDFTIPEPTEDYLVEGIELNMVVLEDTILRGGPNSDDYGEVGRLEQGDEVLIYGIVTEYKGEDTLWYRLSTGEFIDGNHVQNLDPIETSSDSDESNSESSSVESGEALDYDEELLELYELTPDDASPLASSDEESDAYHEALYEAQGYVDNGDGTWTKPDGSLFFGGNPDWVEGGDGPDGSSADW